MRTRTNPAQKKKQHSPHFPNASNSYGRLRGPISSLSLLNSDQLSQQYFRVALSLENFAPSSGYSGFAVNPKSGLRFDFDFECSSLTIWSLRSPTSIFCTKDLYNPGLPPSPRQGFVCLFAVIYEYQGKGAIWSRKCQSWKECPGDLTSLNIDNVDFCEWNRPYQHEGSRPSGPNRVIFSKVCFPRPSTQLLHPLNPGFPDSQKVTRFLRIHSNIHSDTLVLLRQPRIFFFFLI